MLRYALRRLLWSIPTLVATTFVLFLVSTLAASPAYHPSGEDSPGRNAPSEDEASRTRFLDLPLLVNPHPMDVRARAARALRRIADSDGGANADERELVRLGGAALPYVLPELDALAPDARRRVTVALAPLAERMGLSTARDLLRAETAALFWTRLWNDRSLDYTQAVAARAVSRLVEHGSDLREDELVTLDTFALPELVAAMRTAKDAVTLGRLTRIAARTAERGGVLAPDATPEQSRRVVADWEEWWFVHAHDFTPLDGSARAFAVVTETRYGRWLSRIVGGELGVSSVDGEPILLKLQTRAPLTLWICVSAVLLSMALAIPLGAFGAWRRGSEIDLATTTIMLVLHAVPIFMVAQTLRLAMPAYQLAGQRAPVAAAIASLSCGSLATLSRWQRSAMVDVLGQDFMRTARSKGASGLRLFSVHALRHALIPVITAAGLQLPVLFGGAIVVEDVFNLPGAGRETLLAVKAHDVPWLMTILVSTAVAATLGVVASDLAHGALDPRVRELLSSRGGRRSE